MAAGEGSPAGALRYNPDNATTVVVERVATPAGSRVRKELRRPDPAGAGGPAHWAASTGPAHWNYWHREAEVHRDGDLRAALVEFVDVSSSCTEDSASRDLGRAGCATSGGGGASSDRGPASTNRFRVGGRRRDGSRSTTGGQGDGLVALRPWRRGVLG